jgi:uncharacterized protein (TIGR02598 family)
MPFLLLRSTPATIPAIRAGFSLVEVVIALGIVAFAFMLIIALVPKGLRSVKETKEETYATALLQSIATDVSFSHAKGLTTSAQLGLDLTPPASGVARKQSPPVYFDGSQSITNKEATDVRYQLQFVQFQDPNPMDSDFTPSSAHLMLWWPSQATLQNAEGFAETYLLLP